MRHLAETFPPGEVIADEMAARGWSARDVALRMGGVSAEDRCKNELLVLLILGNTDKETTIDPATSEKLERAFGISATFFENLDKIWRTGAVNDDQLTTQAGRGDRA